MSAWREIKRIESQAEASEGGAASGASGESVSAADGSAMDALGRGVSGRDVSGDGAPGPARRVLLIEASRDGLFRFADMLWIDAGDEDEGAIGPGYWSIEARSGIFASAELAEREARRTVPWLRAATAAATGRGGA